MFAVKVLAIFCFLFVTSQCVTEQEILAMGYTLIPNVGYYKIHTTPTTWEEGQSICIDEGGHLAVYNSQEEKKGVGQVMDAVLGREDCYIGFHSLYQDNTAVLVSGIPINTTGIEYYINTENNNRVGSSYAGGLMFWNPRDRKLPFVCERQLWSTYDAYKGHGYYKLHTEGTTWIEAYQTCVNEGAHLVVVNSQQESRILKNILKKHPHLYDTEDNSMVAIGFHMMYDTRDISDKKKQYNTIFGGSIDLAGFSKWAPKQPKPGMENHCGAFTRNGQLYMSKCNMKLAFICEKDI